MPSGRRHFVLKGPVYVIAVDDYGIVTYVEHLIGECHPFGTSEPMGRRM